MTIGLIAHDAKKTDAEFLHRIQRDLKPAFSVCHGTTEDS